MIVAAFLGVGLLTATPIPAAIDAAATQPVLTDAIAPGIVTGSLGLGTSSVAVGAGGYVTMLIASSPALADRTVQIWQEHAPNAWTQAVTRRFASDGTLRYFVRIAAWTALQARYVADHTQPPAESHGRIATVESRGRSVIAASCGDFAGSNGGPDIVRTAGISTGSTVEVDACATPAAGSWSLSTYDRAAIRLVASAASASAQLQTWVFQARQRGSDALEFDARASGPGGPVTWRLTVLLQMAPLVVSVAKDIAFTPDVPCGPGGSCHIRLDVYAPVAPGPWPVVVFLRGGPGGLGSRSDDAAFASQMASEGIVVYNADYRDDAASGAMYPRAFDDAACADRFARATAASHGGDPSRITLVGHSLGAYVGSVVALSADAFAGLCLATGNPAPDAFVGIAGAYLLGEPNLQGDFTSVLGGSRAADPTAWQGGDPFAYVGRRPGVIFRLVHGSADQIVEPAASQALEAALEKVGFDSSLTIVPGGTHTSVLDGEPDVELTIAVILATVR